MLYAIITLPWFDGKALLVFYSIILTREPLNVESFDSSFVLFATVAFRASKGDRVWFLPSNFLVRILMIKSIRSSLK